MTVSLGSRDLPSRPIVLWPGKPEAPRQGIESV